MPDGRDLDADFDAFVRANGLRLLRLAYLLTGERGGAEDLVQTALAKTLPRWSRVRGYENPVGYVHRVMVNDRTSLWRRHRGREHLTDSPPEPAAVTDPAARYDTYDTLLAALRLLPDGQRKVVVLRYYADQSEAQVAETLGCSVGTVKSQSARALGRLRELLGAQPGPDHAHPDRKEAV